MAKNKKGIIVSLISVIVILSIISIISIVYNFVGGFYSSRVVTFANILGEPQTIDVDGVGAYSCACNFSGTTLLNNDISQQITIRTGNVNEQLYFRAKLELAGAIEQDNIMFGYTNWLTNEDGYIYFNQKVGANEQIGLCKYVRLSTNNKFESNLNYILIFVVETSKTNFLS